MPLLPVLPVASELRGHVGPLLEKVRESFAQETGVELLPQGVEEVAREPLLAILFLTGGTEHKALAFASTTSRPLLLLAYGSHNSLPAALETLARLREDGRKAWIVTENLGERPRLFSQAAEIARNLKGKRIGWIGGASPWLMASSQAAKILAEKLGLEIVTIPLSAVLEALPTEAEKPRGEGLGVAEAELDMAGRVYAALKSLAAKENLFAISIACFGLIPHRLTACYALARLSDAGIPGGCEGDLSGLFALILGKFLTGGPGFLANPVDFDLKRERLLLAHCTLPFSLTESFVFRTHFESGIGLAVGGRLKPGPYTLVRFGGLRLEKIFVVEGTVLPESPGREDLCRTQAWFKMSRGALEKLLGEPLGNHHVLVPGHHRPILSLFHSVFLAD